MFSHPVTLVGYLLIGGGAFVAIFFGINGRYDTAFMAMTLGASMEALGFFLILMGVIAQGFLRLERYLSGIPAMKAAFDQGEPERLDTSSYVASSGVNAVNAMELRRQIDALQARGAQTKP